MSDETIKQEHSGSGDNVKEKKVDDKRVSAKGNITGVVVTGSGNTIYIKDDHILLEDYDMARSSDFNTLSFFDNKCIDDIYIEPSFQVNYYSQIAHEYDEQQVNEEFLETIKELIKDKNHIYILGKYGTGKSILLKKIYHFLKSSYDMYFLDLKTLTDEKGDRAFAINESNKTKLFIIDGLDELNIDNLRSKNLIRHILRLAKYADIKFIFGTRLYTRGNEDIAFGLVSDYGDLIKDAKIPFIEINYFTRPMIETWLAKYYPNDDRMELRLKEMEEVDKRLFSMSQIPIFLYHVASYFYSKDIKNLEKEKIYNIYKAFIKITVTGKFSAGFHSSVEYAEKYKGFLMEVAIIIFEKNYEKNYFTKYTENLNKQLFTKNFTISHIKVKNIINNMDIGIIGNDIEKVNNAINCYFFEKINDGFWMFSNTNILLYLISEYYLDSLRHWLQEVDIQNNFKLYIDKTIFEYLVQLLKSKEHHNLYPRLIEKIKSLKGFDKELTDFEYFMGLIYISYDGDKPKLPFILDKIYAYSKSKYDDENYLSLLYSSFQSVYIDDIEFSNIDFSNFNFSYSKLKDVTFKDCTFSKETTFTDVGFDDICFDNCTLKNTTLKNIINSNISFLNCTLNGVHIEGVKESLIKVEGENSQIVRLELHKFLKSVAIEFMNVEKGQSLIIRDNSRASFKFTNTVFDKVNLVHSAIHLKQENCELGIKKEGSSRIINE